jgi:S1-C subfamily serine protease
VSISLVYPSGTVNRRLPLIFTAAIVIICFLTGGLFGYLISPCSNSEKIFDLEEQLANIQNQLSTAQERLETIQNRHQDPIIANYQNTSENFQNIADTVNELTRQLFNLQTQLNQLQTEPTTTNQNITEFQGQLASMQSQLSTLQQQINRLQENLNAVQAAPIYTQSNATYVSEDAFSLNKLFEQVKESVVVVQGLVRQVDFFGRIYYSGVQGSGFIYNYSGRMLILTNNHVISGAVNITVTLMTGEVCAATLLGANPNNDFAVLSINASKSNYKPLEIVWSSTL